MDVVVLDFETYFDKTYSLAGKGKLSTIQYICDKRFEVGGVAVLFASKGRSGEAAFWPNAQEEIEYLQGMYGQNLERCTLVIQNARFDGTILVRHFHCTPRYVVDVKFLSRHLDARNRHRLKDICERLGLTPKGDTMEFHGRHWKDMTEAQRIAYGNYACNDAEIEFAAFAKMLPRITRPEVELPLMHHTQTLFWDPRLAFDFDKAASLIAQIDTKIVEETQDVHATPKEMRGVRSFKALLGTALAETGEKVPMKPGKKQPIMAIAKGDSECKALRRHKNPKVRALIRARLAVKSWPLHQKRIKSMAAQARAAGGLLPNPLTYNGAHTGRWSGGEGINTCNLPTRGSGLQTQIKTCLIAPKGEVLVMADAAQIEARGVAWIAGQTDLLAAFAEGRDVYSEFAAEVLAAPVRKPRSDDPSPVAKLLGGRRALGKVGILGMGYGMGASRALDYMEDFPELAPKVESGEISLQFCKDLVNTYRNKYRMVPKFWKDVENVFRFAMKYPETRTLNGLTFKREGHTLVITLPCGRCLFYPNPSVDADNQLRYRWGHLWGGVLTENIVQAMSRDILAEAILLVEEQGFKVAHHVYDSIVVAVEEDQADAARMTVDSALLLVPSWAKNWPLGVESLVGKVYS